MKKNAKGMSPIKVRRKRSELRFCIFFVSLVSLFKDSSAILLIFSIAVQAFSAYEHHAMLLRYIEAEHVANRGVKTDIENQGKRRPVM